MEASISFLRPYNLSPSILSPPAKTHKIPVSNRRPELRQWWREAKSGGVVRRQVAVKCAKLGVASELGRESEEEMNSEEWIGVGMRGTCEGGKGIVELMECLEREAIMGEDDGREANDYNRRAQIFDKSSRVFQALKEEKK